MTKTKKIILPTTIATLLILVAVTQFPSVIGQQQSTNPGQPFEEIIQEIQQEINQVLQIIDDPNNGNAEIKKEIQFIEGHITSTDFGLEEIKAEVNDIQSKVNSGTFGLQEIKSEIIDIQTTLDAQGCVGCTFVYAVKYTCQNVGTTAGIIYAGPFDLPYRTTVNVHNFHSQTVNFDVKAVGSKSMTLTPAAPSTKENLQLLSDRALHITCDNIKNDIPGAQALGDGFVVIESPVELDVVAVYTAGAGSFSSGRSFGTTMDIEYIEPKLVPPAPANGGGT